MIRLSTAVLCAFCLGSCDEHRDFAYHERAEFNNMMVGEIEDFVRYTAKRWDLVVDEASKKSLIRTNHSGAQGNLFSMVAYVQGSSGIVFVIGNSAVPHILSLSMSYEMGLAPACVNRLHEELKSGLKTKFDIDLRPVDKSGRIIQEN